MNEIDEKGISHRMSRMILVSHPFSSTRPPVFEDKSLGVFLTLASAKSTLCGRSCQPIFSMEVDLDPFSNTRLDNLFRAPSSAVNVFPQPKEKRKK